MGRSLRGARRAARDRSGRGGGRVVLQTALVQAGLHGTTYVMGTTLAGRYLFVVVAEAGRGGVYVVTAREMTEAERRRFRRRAR